MSSTSAQHLEEADACAPLINLVHHPWFLSLRSQQREVLDELLKIHVVNLAQQTTDRLEKKLKVFTNIQKVFCLEIYRSAF